MDNIYHFVVQHGEVFGIRFCDDFNYQTMTAVYTPLAPVWQQNENQHFSGTLPMDVVGSLDSAMVAL